MVLQEICPPALIYLVFTTTQILIDTFKGMYNIAFIKLWVALIFTILLNFLCNKGLGIISWIIVFIPFILMTVIVTLLLVMFGLDPLTGRRSRVTVDKRINNKRHQRGHDKRHIGRRRDRRHHLKKEPYYLSTGLNDKKKNDHLKHGRDFNSGYDEDETSLKQKGVFNDMVSNRTSLNNDPLQREKSI